MAWWTSGQLDSVREAVEAARSGRPTLLIVTGEAGTGKSTLLDRVEQMSAGFVVAAADGVESAEWPFAVITQWGVTVSDTPAAGPLPPFVVAQQLRTVVDKLAGNGPVLLRLDDGQWADRESVEALSWLLRRASGDRLLVVVATRPVPDERQREWAHWSARISAIRIVLTGLTLQDGIRLVATERPEIGQETATRLWEHTSGNPLYLLALLREHDAAELQQMRALPAPAEFARLVSVRLGRLPARCEALARASAVLGSGWVSLLDGAVIGTVENPTDAAERLAAAGLVEARTAGGQSMLRFTHALTRAAVYQQIPLTARRALHAAAAEVVSADSSVLEHRIAAAEQYDEQLADDLESHSRQLSGQSRFRLAAQYLRWASIVTAHRRDRQRRWLDSLLDSIFARDFAVVHAQLDDVTAAADQHRAALVLGALAVLEGRWSQGIATLAAVVSAPMADTDPTVRYRAEVLWAWAGTGAGESNESIEQALGRAAATGVTDQVVAGYALLAGGQVAARVQGTETLLNALPEMPRRPAAMPLEQTYLLSWRGALHAHTGSLPEAIADLREAQHRIQTGFVDVLDGGTHAFLGQTHWMAGQWDLAGLCMRLAMDVAQDFVLPLVRTYLPLLPAGTGNFDRADELLDEAAAVLEDLPWQEAVQAFLVAQVVRLHADDNAASRRRTLLSDLRHRWPRIPIKTGLVSSVWLLHYGIAAIWAGDIDEARLTAARMGNLSPQAPWVAAAVAWLTGLADHTLGARERALEHFRDAAGLPFREMPFYRAHLLTDYGRLARDLGHRSESAAALRQAEEIYQNLRAQPYSARIAGIQDSADRYVTVVAPKVMLTDREKDIMALVMAGMSYRQAAQDLFITESTVSYHLGNIYAKADVKSRHQLTELARRDPSFFGLVSQPA